MAFKLSREQQTELSGMKATLDTAYAEIESAVNAYNEAESELRKPIEAAVSDYNTRLADLRIFVENVSKEQREEYDDKSESWQEGDTGQIVDEWISSWENADLEDATIQFPDEELSVNFENHSELDLPTEP